MNNYVGKGAVASLVISAHIDDREAIQMHKNQPVAEAQFIIALSINISAGIPIAC